PPIHALQMYPFGLLTPRTAYRAVQLINLLLALVTGWGIWQLCEGRVWWPLAVTAVIAYPGFSWSLDLGPNASVTLAMLVWGWVHIARGRQVWGGVFWGLMAFKPVWALAFFVVPLLTGRWRTCLAMLATGVAMAAATLPFVGWHGWMEWLQIGRDATYYYS